MPLRRYRFIQLDVFTDQLFGGNQLAVFPDSDGLADAEMQAIAREMNYSETTFVVPASDPTALCRVRIFTPAVELPLAGHPVVGTAFALSYEGRVVSTDDGAERPTGVRFQLGVGTLPVEVVFAEGRARFAWMHQPVPTFQAWTGDWARLAAALGLNSADIDAERLPLERGSAGVPFVYVPIATLDAIGRASPAPELATILAASECHGASLFTFEAQDPSATAHVRVFVPVLGIDEDAATGAAAGPFGAYLFRHGRIAPDSSGRAQARIEQGIEMGRPSRLEVVVAGAADAIQDVRVGGQAVVVATGELLLDPTP